MITKANAISVMVLDGGGKSSQSYTVPNVQTTKENGTIKNSTMQHYEGVIVQPVLVENEYSVMSSYLRRELTVYVSNEKGESYVLSRNKMTITGAKYIGIQQDQFTLKLQNINFAAFAQSINKGYRFITVKLEDKTVFFGTIKTINTGKENIVEKSIELLCLMKVTELLSDMVSPITVNSSANVWAILEEVTGQKPAIGTLPPDLQTITFEQEYTFTGYKKTVVDDIIAIVNDQLGRSNNKYLPWIDYVYEQDGTMNLFGPYTITEVLNMQPYTGLIDTPTVSEDSIQFNSIYKYKLVPGRVVYMNNALFKTLGNESAFVYAWDPNGLYVITEVRYSLDTYPNKYTCSCKARPLSKYNNFTASIGG